MIVEITLTQLVVEPMTHFNREFLSTIVAVDEDIIRIIYETLREIFSVNELTNR